MPKSIDLVDQLPKMSPLMTQLLARLSSINVSVGQLAEITERDAALSAQVLRMANSAAFARLEPVTSVRHAISLVGTGVLRKFVMATSLVNLFKRYKVSRLFSITRFNLHSVATATMLEILSEEIPLENSNQAFVTGLLHDVGELLIAINCPKEHEDILALGAVTGQSQIECERRVLGLDHAELSAMAIERWKLPESVQEAVRKHHETSEPDGSGQVKLSDAVHQIDDCMNFLGMSILPPTVSDGSGPKPLEFPGIKFSNERVMKRFEDEWLQLGELLK